MWSCRELISEIVRIKNLDRDLGELLSQNNPEAMEQKKAEIEEALSPLKYLDWGLLDIADRIPHMETVSETEGVQWKVKMSPDGTYLAIDHFTNLILYQLKSKKEIPIPSPEDDMIVSEFYFSKRYVHILFVNGSHEYDLKTFGFDGQEVEELQPDPDTKLPLRLAVAGNVTNYSDRFVGTYDGKTISTTDDQFKEKIRFFAPENILERTGKINRIEFTSGNRFIITHDSDGLLLAWSVVGLKYKGIINVEADDFIVTDAGVLVSSKDGVTLYDPATLMQEGLAFESQDAIKMCRVEGGDEHELIALLQSDNTIRLYDTNDWQPVCDLFHLLAAVKINKILSIFLTKEKKMAITMSDGRIIILSKQKHQKNE